MARHEGHVIGFVTCGTRTHWAGDTDAYVGELVVTPAWSRRGVGRRLMQEAENWARSYGHSRLTLETGSANASARPFYESMGYLEEEVVLTREL